MKGKSQGLCYTNSSVYNTCHVYLTSANAACNEKMQTHVFQL